MLWNERCLFIHYPKTAGKTLTSVFAKSWTQPLYGILSKGLVDDLGNSSEPGIQLKEGRGHENIRRACTVLEQQGLSLDRLEVVISCVRNPYSLMVSNYFFLREHFPNNRHIASFQMANELDFDEFCEQLQMPKPRDFYSLRNGQLPANLRFIRFEHLKHDLLELNSSLGYSLPDIPHLNPSQHAHYSAYLTERSETAIHNRFEYFFEVGGYTRYSF